MNLNFWPKMYYSGGGGGGGSGGGGGGAGGGGGGASAGGGGGGYGGGAGAGGSGGSGGGAAGEQPPEEPTPVGAFRFNTDTAKLEYYDGNQWVNVTTDSPEQNTGGTRGLWGGGAHTPGGGAPYSNVIDYANIASTGNAADFGDCLQAKTQMIPTSGRVRGIFFGGYTTSSDIRTVMMSSQGNQENFGNLSSGRWGSGACSDGIKAICMGGTLGPGTETAGENFIEYITIAQTGNAIDFGDLTYEAGGGACGGINSPTRGILMNGHDDNENAHVNTINYITMSTLGNATDFGDTATISRYTSGGSNAIRGIRSRGYSNADSANSNNMEFITIASTGGTEDFGDATIVQRDPGSAASSTRFVMGGGFTDPALVDTMDYVQIMTTGNAVDFGDLTQARGGSAGMSNGHGGLG